MTEHASPSATPPRDASPPVRTQSSSRSGRYLIGFLVLTLIIIHQDNWFWTSDYLVFGFMPVALFYHACISLAATAVWFLATRIAWPEEIIQQVEATTGTEVRR